MENLQEDTLQEDLLVNRYDGIVIGAGAAGMMAAGTAA